MEKEYFEMAAFVGVRTVKGIALISAATTGKVDLENIVVNTVDLLRKEFKLTEGEAVKMVRLVAEGSFSVLEEVDLSLKRLKAEKSEEGT